MLFSSCSIGPIFVHCLFQKTLDLVLFCERYVYLKVNFIIQQKESFENNYFVSDMILLKKCIILDRIDFVWEIKH